MLELDLFTLEWKGMVQFDTFSDKIYINTDRRDVPCTLIFTSKENHVTVQFIGRKQCVMDE
jgi:hypothetical protein